MPALESRESSRSAVFTGAVLGFLFWIIADQLGLLGLLPPLRNIGAWPSLLFLVGGAWIYATRARRVLQISAAALICLWLIVSLTPLSGWMVKRTELAMPPRAADAVIVLSAGMQLDNEFEDRMLPRLLRGLELVRSGYAPVLVLTDVESQPGRLESGTKELLAGLDISLSMVMIGPVYDTHDEALVMQKLAQERGWKTILVVTSPSHTRRSWLTFRKTGLDAIIVPAQETTYDFQNPIKPDDRRDAFNTALREMVGTWVYRRRGWI